MAKTVSPIFKFQGTIEDLTFVNSRRYKPHVRARKNSKTPFVMTAALAESKVRLQQCNQYAKPVFQALKAEMPDGGLWSRLVSKLFAELKGGRPLGLACLQGLECNLQHKLGEVLPKGYDLSATESQNQLGIYVQLHGHPAADDELPRTGYQVRFVLITLDAANGTFHKTAVLGPLTKYKDELNTLDLPIELSGKGAPYILLMGIVPHLQGEGAARIMSDSGMRVVWVGEQAAEGRQAVSCELRATRESQASSGELRAASGIQEGMERQAASLEPGTAIPTSLSPSWDRATSGIQKGKIREQVSEENQAPVCVVTGQVEMGQAMNGEGQRVILASLPVGRDKATSGEELATVVVDVSGNGIGGVAGLAIDEPCEIATPLVVAADDGGGALAHGLVSTKKGPEPLMINLAGSLRQGLPAGADHEDAAFVLPLKGRLTGGANNENNALLNAYQRATSGSDEIILHNKTFKNEKITAKAACSIQCGMSARPKRNAE
ncbi:hypothetical protein D3H65_15980 [Paraflavitalea soli]|uniref:Uncharacterized protein n=1 Tax=Paraflavitalea soli TaxID=2315862 RepID=A0A3B7MLT1_9BACT|nr:hypothetical protein [Paraflavitalea soli]AXY75392.1 hypothetical protein D3H65_15980 [Paraflavitalea soli]